MPSKFVAKSFAREEIAQSADRIRRDVVALIERSLPEFKDTYSIDNYSQKINHLLELKEKVNGISSELNMHCKKISRLVEGSIRRVISLQKSEPWVRSITVDSAADIVTFFQTSLKETQAWHDRSLTMVTDFLRDPGTVTRLVVLISGVISLSDDDKWGGLRELVAQYPWYKLVRVRISDGTRSDWDQSPYDEASYYVEHEPLHRGIARAIPLAPFWLRGVLISLTRLYQPIFRLQPSDLYRNYDAFAQTNASLACLVMMSDRLYENYLIDLPAHTLEWDMAGSMRVVPDAALVLEGEEALKLEGGEALVLEGGEALVLEGGEIKSCFRDFNAAKWQLERRFRLLSLVASIVMPTIKSTVAMGTAYAPSSKNKAETSVSESSSDLPATTTTKGNHRSPETEKIENLTYIVNFQIVDEFY